MCGVIYGTFLIFDSRFCSGETAVEGRHRIGLIVVARRGARRRDKTLWEHSGERSRLLHVLGHLLSVLRVLVSLYPSLLEALLFAQSGGVCVLEVEDLVVVGRGGC
ncbi:hypothetical protein E2542_SST00713 [Spatholobus suberectus]|nr:hypothetical protein E2542_SST00713 [Spatholobus suberectus]